MSEREWTDGEPWGTDSYRETCTKCGKVNEITVPEGPPSGNEKFSVECASCGASLDSVEAFGPPRVRVVKL